jgi:hypothetical protein
MKPHQFQLNIPPRDTNAILRERIADIENRIRAFGAVGDDAACLDLLRERTRLQKLLRGGPSTALTELMSRLNVCNDEEEREHLRGEIDRVRKLLGRAPLW